MEQIDWTDSYRDTVREVEPSDVIDSVNEVLKDVVEKLEAIEIDENVENGNKKKDLLVEQIRTWIKYNMDEPMIYLPW